MTGDELRKSVLDTLGDIAPEADLGVLPPDREELDIDPMDFLNFVIAMHEKLGVETPKPIIRSSSRSTAPVVHLTAKMGTGPAGLTR